MGRPGLIPLRGVEEVSEWEDDGSEQWEKCLLGRGHFWFQTGGIVVGGIARGGQVWDKWDSTAIRGPNLYMLCGTMAQLRLHSAMAAHPLGEA